MSHSKEDRLLNQEAALTLMLQEIGERYYSDVLISKARTTYQNIYPTTWQDLGDSYEVKDLLRGDYCMLTSYGWIRSLKQTGALDRADFLETLGRISHALKDRVKGRQQPALATSDEIANEAGVPVGLVQSVIDSGLLLLCFRKVQADWASPDDQHLMIFIPINFGLEEL